mmetsp:Transcript_82399/g.207334  ORF Transcript_82399/g.207334 Transcript_82399/m.207334 type:complete len:85 (-) Transcript_82399:13-267(-)
MPKPKAVPSEAAPAEGAEKAASDVESGEERRSDQAPAAARAPGSAIDLEARGAMAIESCGAQGGAAPAAETRLKLKLGTPLATP